MVNFLTLSQVSKTFTQGATNIKVLDNLSFCFDFSKSYAIIGASGVGKSTLMHILAGTDLPDSGTVNWCDQFIVNTLSQNQKELFWNQKVGLIFQQPGLIDELTVLENVALKGLISNQPGAFARARELLQLLGLQQRSQFFPDVLSRGEQQRVAIARAVMCNSGLILADEPTASLDKTNGLQVVDLLVNLAKRQQIGLIVSTHDEYVYRKMDVILTILDGKLGLSSEIGG